MASVFKRKDRTGSKSKVWYYKYLNHTGKQVYCTGWPDKRKTVEHALAVEAEHRAIRNGEKEVPPSWLQQRNKPIGEVIADYLDWGRAQGGRGGRPWADQHAKQKKRWIARWVKTLNLRTLGDISLDDVERAAREYTKTRSSKTANNKVEALRSLCRWAVTRRFLRADPLAGFRKFNETPGSPHRPLDAGEIAALLRVAPAERKVWYEVALATGYRVGELKQLKVGSLDMFMPSLKLGADFTKNRKDARQPITRELADQLAAKSRGKNDDDSLLNIPMREAWHPFNEDRDKAGILAETGSGRATWHSMRKVYVDALVRSGADLKTVMTLARHSTASLTMDVYASADDSLLTAAAAAAAAHIKDVVDKACSGYVPQAVAVNQPPPIKEAPSGAYGTPRVVGDTGLEPVTSRV